MSWAGPKEDKEGEAAMKFSSGLRKLLFGCDLLKDLAHNCVVFNPGCVDCFDDNSPDDKDLGCGEFADDVCTFLGDDVCPECAPCFLRLEDYYKCIYAENCPEDSPRLHCRLGMVHFLGELPFIGFIFNFLFGWLANIFGDILN